MRAVIFIGPSVEPELVRSRFSEDIRAPIRRGDLDAVLREPDPPRHVGIVDGEFLQALAVTPKEVVRALDCGVRVYGASSIGALRAAECAPFGMVGVGRIFNLYASGKLDADDEVAVTHDPLTFRPLSEAMVNMRIALEAAVAAGIVLPATGKKAIAAAKSLYFPSRTYPNLLRRIGPALSPPERAALSGFLTRPVPDQKRADALALIDAIGAALATESHTAAPKVDRPSSGGGDS